MRALLTILGILAFPLAEIAAFIAVGSEIGVGWTLVLILASTVLGIAIVRSRSLAALRAARAEARAGRVPEREIAAGAVTVLGGLLMIVPGFITSAAGLVLALPPVARAIAGRMASRVVVRTAPGGFGARYGAKTQPRGPFAPGSGVVDLDEAEFERRGEPRPDSPWREIEDERDGQGGR